MVFNDIVDMLDDRRIIEITGPRKTGKTTPMFQLMDMLIKEKNEYFYEGNHRFF